MKLIDKIETRNAVIAIIGLGYVGLPLAVAFAEAAIAFSFLVLVLYIFTAALGAVAWWLDFADKREVAK